MMEIVFYLNVKNESKLTKLHNRARTLKEGFEFAIKFCKEFALVTPLAFSIKTLELSINTSQLYYYDDTEVYSYLNNQMTQEELLENNWCDALVRNTEDLQLINTDIDAGSLFVVRGDYAYYIEDYSIRIPLSDLTHDKIILL